MIRSIQDRDHMFWFVVDETGEKLRRVVYADDTEGYYIRHVIDEQGKLVRDASGSIATETICAKIRFEKSEPTS